MCIHFFEDEKCVTHLSPESSVIGGPPSVGKSSTLCRLGATFFLRAPPPPPPAGVDGPVNVGK